MCRVHAPKVERHKGRFSKHGELRREGVDRILHTTYEVKVEGGGGERGGVLHVVWPFIKRALACIHARKHMLTQATCLIDSGSDKGVKKAAPFEGTFLPTTNFLLPLCKVRFRLLPDIRNAPQSGKSTYRKVILIYPPCKVLLNQILIMN